MFDTKCKKKTTRACRSYRAVEHTKANSNNEISAQSSFSVTLNGLPIVNDISNTFQTLKIFLSYNSWHRIQKRTSNKVIEVKHLKESGTVASH